MAQKFALTLDATDQAFADWLAQQGYKPNTVRTYINAARQFRHWWIARQGGATTLAKEKAVLKKVTLTDLIHFQSEQPLMSASTHRSRLSGLAKLLTWVGINGDILINQLRQQKKPRTRQVSAPSILSDREEAQLREFLQATLTAATNQRLRDAACVALVLAAGLRRRELCDLKVASLGYEDDYLIVRVDERSIPVTDAVLSKVVGRWYERQRRNGQSYLFSPFGRSDSTEPSEAMFNVAVKRVFFQAGLTDKSASLQRLRNTCITQHIRAGVAVDEMTNRFGISAYGLARLADVT